MQFSKYVLSSLAAESGFLIMQLVMEESILENVLISSEHFIFTEILNGDFLQKEHQNCIRIST